MSPLEGIMKRFLLLSLACVLICKASEAANVNCTSCSFGETTCSSTCSAEMCITLRELDSEKNVNGTYRGCISANMTCNPLAFTFSTAENRQVRSNVACCASEKCNQNLTLSVPPASSAPNGKNCDACEEYNKTTCESSQKIACKGAENKCISLTGILLPNPQKNETLAIKGCATESACSLVKGDLIVYKSQTYQLSGNSNCTAANRASLSTLSSAVLILPAVVPLLLASIFS